MRFLGFHRAPTWRPRGLSKSAISRVIIRVTPFRVLITLLITHLLCPLGLQVASTEFSPCGQFAKFRSLFWIPKIVRHPYIKRTPQRDPNLENCPYAVQGFLAASQTPEATLLGGSWVVISGVISKVTITVECSCALKRHS